MRLFFTGHSSHFRAPASSKEFQGLDESSNRKVCYEPSAGVNVGDIRYPEGSFATGISPVDDLILGGLTLKDER